METVASQSQLLVPIGYVVGIIGTLASAIGVLFWHLQKQNAVWRSESNSNIVKMTQVITENNHAIQMLGEAVKNNTKSTDKIFEHLNRALK